MFIFRLKNESVCFCLCHPASLPHLPLFNQHNYKVKKELIIDLNTLMPNNKKNNNSNSNQTEFHIPFYLFKFCLFQEVFEVTQNTITLQKISNI